MATTVKKPEKAGQRLNDVTEISPKSELEDNLHEAAVVWEGTVDKVVARIVSTLSWANSGILNSALQMTFFLMTTQKVTAGWIYFFIVFAACYLVSFLPNLIRSPDEIAKRFDLKQASKENEKKEAITATLQSVGKAKSAPEQQGADVLEEADQSGGGNVHEEKESISLAPVSQDPTKEPKEKPLRVVETQVNEFLEKLLELFTQTLCNVVAMSFQAAIKASIPALSTKPVVGAFFIYALVVDLFGFTVCVRMGDYMEKKEDALEEHISEGMISDHQDDLLNYAARSQLVQLIKSILTLMMGWATRDFIGALIGTLTNDPQSKVVTAWANLILGAILVTLLETTSQRYYILYPYSTTGWLQLGSEKRKFAASTAKSTLDWYVAIGLNTAIHNSINRGKSSVTVAVAWIVAILLMLLGVFAEGYLNYVVMKIKVAGNHPYRALFDALEYFDVFDDVEDDEDQEMDEVQKALKQTKAEDFTYTQCLLITLVELTTFSLGMTGGMSVTGALTSTFQSIYNVNTAAVTTRPTGSIVGSSWAAVVICMLISVFMLRYLAKIVEKARQERRKLMSENSVTVQTARAPMGDAEHENAGLLSQTIKPTQAVVSRK